MRASRAAITPDLPVSAVAELLSVTPGTVRRLVATGALKAYRLTGPRSPLRIRPDDVEAYREAQTAPDPWVRTRDRRAHPARRTS